MVTGVAPDGTTACLGDVNHRRRRGPPCSQPLFRFRRETRGGRWAVVSYLGMTPGPYALPPPSEGRTFVENRWSTLVRAVKFRHSAYASGCRTPGYWQVQMASSGC
ncbi:hypothetical protein Saso_31280 [Streptomyces asoensis]|uniref:Transposase IS701-like DDE domain-containing protein n=1 Tax=Streptomyces asoensis TaxID=249586 RepID=A0ABQ3S030_9ACTN|nr:hypothetical protein GCM10010496_24610 [Streptomyces asoensis]GHI61478.1 hypothetical protein Saso_31280 [Streptomyces asoensis]